MVQRRSKRRNVTRLMLEQLEQRLTPSAMATPTYVLGFNNGIVANGNSPQASGGFTPAQVQQAYGTNLISFGGVQGNGAGETIAIVDAYDQPTLAADLQAFDQAFNLAAPPSFTKVNQTGGSTLPAANTGWGLEESLDVEWAHAIAPAANILLVEANSNSTSDLMAAVDYARNAAGVVVVSMSWGASEYSGETSNDSHFVTPTGHNGVTFVASSGDNGAGVSYPAASPNVLAVGGTSLTLDSNSNWSAEGGWSGSGGGVSSQETQPSYQEGFVTQSTTNRAVPDVAFDADPNTGFAVIDSSYSSTGGPWYEVGGTSAGAPQWAALIAIADQGRALQGQGSLDGVSQTLPAIYHAPSADFHDITTGSNGYNAGPGYDLVTGLGTPVANLLVPTLVSNPQTPAAFTVSALNLKNSSGTAITYGTPGATIKTSPTLVDIGQVAATNVSIQISSGTTGVTVVGASSQTIGDVNPGTPIQPPTPFQVQLSSSLTDLQQVQLNFVITFTDAVSGQQQQTTVTKTFSIVKLQPQAEVKVNFTPGQMVADPTRDVVYLIDKSSWQLVAINTDNGTTIGVANLAGSPNLGGSNNTSTPSSGQMAVSLDGTKLYVALSDAQEIQVFSLPTLTSLAVFSYTFNPVSIACGVNNMLYVTSTDYWGNIRQVDATTGAVVNQFNKGGTNGTFYQDTLLRMNATGTHLYATEVSLQTVGGPNYVYEYDVTGSTPQLINPVPYQQTNSEDFAVDEATNRVYTANGGQTNGAYGIEVSNTLTDTYNVTWPLGNPYAVGVALLPGSPVVYGASGGPYYATIVRYQEQDGSNIGTYSIGQTLSGATLPSNSVRITPNGALMYVVDQFTGSQTTPYLYSIGIIGSSSLTITLPISLAPLPQTQWTVSQAYSQTIVASGGTGTLTLSRTGTVPPGLTFNTTTGLLSGTPTATGTYTFTVTATDSTGAHLSQNYSLTINPALSLGALGQTQWTVNVPGYSQQITVTGGTGSDTFSSTGSLPAGITLNSTTGALSGKPTAFGTFTFTITAHDSIGATGSRSYTLTILPAAPTAVNDSYTVDANSTLSITTALTTSLYFNSQSGDYIGAGQTNTWAASSGTFTATALTGNSGVAINYTNSGNSSVYWMLHFAAPSGMVLTPGYYANATRWPFEASMVPGLDVSGEGRGSNTLTGNFTVLEANYGPSGQVLNFDATFEQHSEGATPALFGEIRYNAATGPVGVLANDSDPNGLPLSAVLVSGPSHGSLTLNSNGTLAYTPTANFVGTDTFTYEASNGQVNSNVATVTITVNSAITLSGLSQNQWTANQAYSQTITASGGTGNLTLSHSGVIPPGLTFNDSTGILSGTPTAAGSYTFNVTATDTLGTQASQSYTLIINPALSLSSLSQTQWTLNQGYTQTISASGGTGSLALSHSGSIPTGLTFDDSIGVLSGIPTAVGTFTFNVTATDSVGAQVNQTYSVTINPAISLGGLAQTQWTLNQGYTQTITVSGGTGGLALSHSGSLPTGLTFDDTTGILSGTPSATGTFTFSVTGTDGIGAQTTQSYSVTINPPVSLGSLGQSQWTMNETGYDQTIIASGGTGALTLSHTGSIPTGLTFDDSTGILSGTPTAAGTFTFSATGTDSIGAQTSQSYTVVINPAVSLSALAQTQWTPNQPYSQTITASGGTGAVTLFHSGSIPTGLTFDDSTGILSGTPTVSGSYNFTVTATDSIGAQISQNYTLTVSPAISLTSLGQAQWTINQAGYSQTISASGGTGALTLSHSGSIPTGLTFDDSTGILAGTPTAVGSFAFTVTATDSIGAQTSQNYTITINPAVSLGGLGQSQWTTSQAGYSQTITASGGTGALTLSHSGSIPTGLTFDDSTGSFSGTPTATGSFTFTVSGSDSIGAQTSQSYTVVINPAVSLSALAQTQWTANQAGYSQTINTSGGTGVVTLSHSGSIPTGLAFDDSTGILSGTPTAVGAFTFNVTATDSVGAQVNQTYSVTINPAVSLGGLAQTQWTLNQAGYSQTIIASGGTGGLALSHSGSLPTDLTFDDTTGILSGTPTATGTFTFSLTGTDSIGAQTTQSYTVTINPVVTLGSLTQMQWTVNQAGYSQTIVASGGTGVLTLSHGGSIPSGLTFNDSTGILSGTPAATGTFTFSLTATDSIGAQTTQNYTVTINPAVTLGSLAQTQWTINQAGYSQTITTSGGTGNLALSHSGSIPAGLTFNDSTGILSGTPTATGSFMFTVTSTDQVGAQTSQTYTITINPAVSLDALGQTQWLANQAGYSQTIAVSGGTGGVTLSHTGSIPPGLTFNDATGVLSGTPTTAGTYNFTVTGTDSVGAQTSQTYTLTINPAITFSSLSQTQWTVNRSGYSQTITVSGGTGGITLSHSGSIPTGMTFNNSTGVLSGTPAVAGTYTFTVTATDNTGEQATNSYTITINATPTLGSLSQTQWTVNQTGYNGTIAINGGTGPYSGLSVSGLPSGITASLSGGVIILSGKPTQTGTFNVHVTVKDVTGASVTSTYSLIINKAMSLGTLSLTTWKVNQAGQTGTITISGGTAAYRGLVVTGLPPGLTATLNGNTITFSGTPTTIGSYTIGVTVQDSTNAIVTKNYTISVRS
jgi:hypothetical protein